MEITELDRAIIQGLAAGKGLTTLDKSISEKLKKKYGRLIIERQAQKLIKEGILLEIHAVVNPIKTFENVIVILAETESIVTPKTQVEKEYGLNKFLGSVQEFTEFKTVLGFVIKEGEYDFGIILGVQDIQGYQEFLKKLEETGIFKRISYHVISASEKFVFNPIALP
jgi:DNA-binding Lrp family transcriptional regulator